MQINKIFKIRVIFTLIVLIFIIIQLYLCLQQRSKKKYVYGIVYNYLLSEYKDNDNYKLLEKNRSKDNKIGWIISTNLENCSNNGYNIVEVSIIDESSEIMVEIKNIENAENKMIVDSLIELLNKSDIAYKNVLSKEVVN